MKLIREQLRGRRILVGSMKSLRENLTSVTEFKSLFPHSYQPTSCPYNQRHKFGPRFFHPIPRIYYCLSIHTHVFQWSLISVFTTKILHAFLISGMCVTHRTVLNFIRFDNICCVNFKVSHYRIFPSSLSVLLFKIS